MFLRNSFCDRGSVKKRCVFNSCTYPDSTKPCARYIRLLELPFFLVVLKSKTMSSFFDASPRNGAHFLRLVFLKRRKMFNP